MKIVRLWLFNLFCTIFLNSSLYAESCIAKYLIEVEGINPFSGMSFIDCVYVINLEKRIEKWYKTKEALNYYAIYPSRVKAVNGWELTEQDINCLMGPHPHRMRGGQIGCILSHLSTLRDAYQRQYQCVWICEDDIAIQENPHQLSMILLNLSQLDPDWDVLYTDVDTKGPTGIRVPSLMSDFRPNQEYQPIEYYRQRTKITENISEIKQRFGAYSMLVSRKGIEKILNYFTNLYLWTSYDIDIHYIPNIKEYSLNRDLVSIGYKSLSDTEMNN